MALEKLSAPPIVEVVCGLVFEPLGALNPLTLGGYEAERRGEYPHHQLHPPIMDAPATFKGSLPPIRTWLISSDDAWVIQVQWDRFYLNWRARGGNYPRFSDPMPGVEGVLSKFLREFETFGKYCKDALGAGPTLLAIELSKVDHFEQGRSWTGFTDLATMLPLLRPFAAAATSTSPLVGAQFHEERGGGVLTVGLDVGAAQAKLETRLVKQLEGDLRQAFESANVILNDVFNNMVPVGERSKRFQGDQG